MYACAYIYTYPAGACRARVGAAAKGQTERAESLGLSDVICRTKRDGLDAEINPVLKCASRQRNRGREENRDSGRSVLRAVEITSPLHRFEEKRERKKYPMRIASTPESVDDWPWFRKNYPTHKIRIS